MDKKRIHVMSNTHWDREHRHGFQETKIMLVELIDELIEIMENNSDYCFFTMDGQSIMLEDYLDIKPHMKKRLEGLIKGGRILIGPWCTLVDCNAANGEGIIRNLLKGHRVCKEYGGAMKLGYSIFSFGQIAQMPQIYGGFGIDSIIFYKNPSREVLPKSEFIWTAPDGTKALASRLGRDCRWNFFFNFSIPVILGGDARIPGWEAAFNNKGRLCHMVDDNFIDQYSQQFEQDICIREENIVKAVCDVLASVDESVSEHVFLGFEGTDFTSPLKDIPEALRKANDLMHGEIELVHSNPLKYIKELKADIDMSSLTEYTGEMRFGPISSIHSEVMGANVELKQATFKAENALMYYAEPFLVFGKFLGNPYPIEIINKAWKYLFQVYAHDSIHGSGVPKLKPDNVYRLAQVQEIADSMTRRAIENIVSNINIGGLEENTILLSIFNPTPYERSEVMQVKLDLPSAELIKDFWLEDLNGSKVDIYRYTVTKYHLACINRPNRPKTVYSDRVDLDIFVKGVPAYGYKTYKVKWIKGDPAKYQPFTPVGIFPFDPIGISGNVLDNGLLKVTIQNNGSVEIYDYETNITHKGINIFMDSGCCGNMWAHKMPDNNRTISSKGFNAEISIIRNSYLSATYRVSISINIPESLTSDKKARTSNTLPTEIVSYITLVKDSKRVDFKTSFENRSRDHMLTVRIPTGIRTSVYYSECPFEVRQRPVGKSSRKDGIIDDSCNLTRNIFHNFIDLSDGVNGIAIFTKGLMECEVNGKETQEIILTLLRAVSNTIPIHDDLYVDFREEPSQCIGEHCFEYSVQLHKENWIEGKVVPLSRMYSLPMMAVQIGKGEGGRLPLQNTFFELKEANLTLSGIKQTEDGTGVIIRLFNPSDKPVLEMVDFPYGFKSVYMANMNEEELEEVRKIEGNTIYLEVPPFKIVTLKIV